tara:strand:- start:335 stop:712 length:378 start_codon:yes stop_codon:yes gene_type:complete
MQRFFFDVKERLAVLGVVFICTFGMMSTASFAGLPNFLNGFQSRSGYSEADLDGFCDEIKIAVSVSVAISKGADYAEAVRPHLDANAGPVETGDFGLRLAFIGEALGKLSADPDARLIFDKCGVQ